jgi:hypothetical protein
MNIEIMAGELWESVDVPGREAWQGEPAGLCLVVGPNVQGVRESPDSYVMMRLTPGRRRWERVGQTLYMHRSARDSGQWVRRGVLAAVAGSN